jgi:zinc transporter ZupT
MNFVVHSLLLGSHHKGVDQHDHQHTGDEASSDDMGPAPVCCTSDTGAQIDKLQRMGEEIEEREHSHSHAQDAPLQLGHSPGDKAKATSDDEDDDSEALDDMEEAEDFSVSGQDHNHLSPEERRRLNRMSLNTAIAIAMHNFPEGLATFVAALDDPRVGAVLAIAIAIHNIPEGKTLECLLVLLGQSVYGADNN